MEDAEIREQLRGDPAAVRRIAAGGRAVCPQLVVRLGDPDPVVARRARAALIRIGEDAVDDLFSGYRAANIAPQIAHETVDFIRKRTIPRWLEDLRTHPDPARRASAAFWLGQLKVPRAIGPLSDALTDSNFLVRIGAAHALAALRQFGAIPRIRALLDGSYYEAFSAATALAQLGDRTGAEQLIRSLSDVDRDIRADSAHHLGLLRESSALPELDRRRSKDPAPTVRDAAAEAIDRILEREQES